ncbi:MAG: GNAT family N-acetyltransferase [Bryobacterales bacterium]|nr:GNAT family N-acetyltransferase [Bryobacterales bacterium]
MNRVATLEDTYAIGDYVRRFAPSRIEPQTVMCRVIDPTGQVSFATTTGSVVRHTDGGYFWHMIAGRIGQWRLNWSSMDAVEDRFMVIDTPPDVSTKQLPILSDGALTLVPLAPVYLETVRRWRNRDDIRCWFYDSAIISADAQLVWYYERYLPDPTDYMWVALWQGKPVGTGALTHVDLVKREGEWSRLMIGEDSARGLGLAGRIAALVRDYGLDTLKLNRIFGSLYTHNRNTMHIDQAAGYMPYREENGITFVELWRRNWRKEQA